jgi:hypothetical protein
MTSMVAEQSGQRGRFVASGRSVLVAVPSNSRQRARAVSLLRLAKKPKWRMQLLSNSSRDGDLAFPIRQHSMSALSSIEDHEEEDRSMDAYQNTL